jgi:hypothetical protein
MSAHRAPPRIFTDASRPLCRGGYFKNQDLIHLAILSWLSAQESGQSAPPEQQAIVRNTLSAVVVGQQDPRKVFGWPAPGAKPPDKRLTRNAWREQWMAAETLRLVYQSLADDEAAAVEYVADAFDVSEQTVKAALAEWRSNFNSGDLTRYLDYLKTQI